MQAQVTKINRLETKDGPTYMLTFTLDNGKSGRTWVCERFGNYRNWKDIILKGVGATVTGIECKGRANNLVNADSAVKLVN